MKLLDDLNMDSIKAAELLTLVAKEHELGDALPLTQFANASIAEIARAIFAQPQPTSATVATVAQQRPTAPTRRPTWVRNFVEEAVREDLAAAPDTAWQQRHVWLIGAEGADLARQFAGYLSARQARISETSIRNPSGPSAGEVTDVLIVIPASGKSVDEASLSAFINGLHDATMAAIRVNRQGAKPRITFVQRTPGSPGASRKARSTRSMPMSGAWRSNVRTLTCGSSMSVRRPSRSGQTSCRRLLRRCWRRARR
jgi:hypothetical protein